MVLFNVSIYCYYLLLLYFTVTLFNCYFIQLLLNFTVIIFCCYYILQLLYFSFTIYCHCILLLLYFTVTIYYYYLLLLFLQTNVTKDTWYTCSVTFNVTNFHSQLKAAYTFKDRVCVNYIEVAAGQNVLEFAGKPVHLTCSLGNVNTIFNSITSSWLGIFPSCADCSNAAKITARKYSPRTIF